MALEELLFIPELTEEERAELERFLSRKEIRSPRDLAAHFGATSKRSSKMVMNSRLTMGTVRKVRTALRQ